MHRLTIYPLGNGETLRIDLENGRKVLIDYANLRNANDPNDLRCDLPTLLKKDLKTVGREDYDAVAFTHLDDDHICGAKEFFYFQYSSSLQGEGRIKMNEMWVPAYAVLETSLDGDARAVRDEARYRLKEKKGEGVRVFSAPGTLKKWFEDNNIDIADYRKRGIVLDAGKLVPTFTLADDDVEFFIHSPFASRTEDGTLHVRNTDAIVMQATFQTSGEQTRFLITADVPYDQLDEIGRVTKLKKNEFRLEWDVADIPHHCSYTALGPEKGKDKTEPTENIDWLYKEQGQEGGIIVSSSKPIPSDDSDNQPPHRQAAAYYKEVASVLDGEFALTMEHPRKSAPEPLVIEITSSKAAIRRAAVATVGSSQVSRPAHRVG